MYHYSAMLIEPVIASHFHKSLKQAVVWNQVSDLEMKVDDLETDQVLNDYEYLSDRVDFLEDYIMSPTREAMENEEQKGDSW